MTTFGRLSLTCGLSKNNFDAKVPLNPNANLFGKARATCRR